MWPWTHKGLRLPISFRNKNLNLTKLATVQLVGRPIFNIRYPMFGMEKVALDTRVLEAAN